MSRHLDGALVPSPTILFPLFARHTVLHRVSLSESLEYAFLCRSLLFPRVYSVHAIHQARRRQWGGRSQVGERVNEESVRRHSFNFLITMNRLSRNRLNTLGFFFSILFYLFFFFFVIELVEEVSITIYEIL